MSFKSLCLAKDERARLYWLHKRVNAGPTAASPLPVCAGGVAGRLLKRNECGSMLAAGSASSVDIRLDLRGTGVPGCCYGAPPPAVPSVRVAWCRAVRPCRLLCFPLRGWLG